MNKKNVAIITLGCKVNQYESDAIAQELINREYKVENGLKPADIYIINTCAVTNEGERKSRMQIAKILKINNKAKIYVCGCAAQYNPKKFKEKPQVKYVTGTSNKMQIVEAIERNETGEHVIQPPSTYEDNMTSLQSRTRAFVKIQDGCNSFCSYCIIPYLRGRSRSRTIDSIKKEIDNIKSNEIVFAGVNVSEYGKDLPTNPTLIDVVELMRGRKARFRFSSLEMGSITSELLMHLSTMKNFCPHFHLSMQSGSNSVLKRMNRKYTNEQYLKTINEIRKVFPNAGITTDVIAGFPGETEEEFKETISTIKKAKFYEMHVFPYSPREGTVAATMQSLNGDIIKNRASELIKLGKELKFEFMKNQISTIQEVLVEKVDESNIAEGYSKNYLRVKFKTNKKHAVGEIIFVKIISINSEIAHGIEQNINEIGV